MIKKKKKNISSDKAVAMEVKGRRPVGKLKKTWSKVVEEDMRKLNITDDMVEDRKQ